MPEAKGNARESRCPAAVAGIHPTASLGFSRVAQAYDRGRPDYPKEAVDRLATELDLHSGRRVLEVGAGTGKLTRRLLETGAEVIAVEPVAEMRAILRESAARALLMEGRAEALPVPPCSVDGVAVGQAFHWFRGPEALSEFDRVLRPDAKLGLVWNVRDDRDPLSARLSAILEPYRGSTPRYKEKAWQRAFGGSSAFRLSLELRFDWVATMPVARLIERVMSVSCVGVQPWETQERIRREAEALLRREARGAPTVSLPHYTELYIYRHDRQG